MNHEPVSDYIDVEEVYQCILMFITTNELISLSKNDRMNVISFKLVKERPKSDSDFDS